MARSRVIFIFVDGLGIGKSHVHNPFHRHCNSLQILNCLNGEPFSQRPDYFNLQQIDASLGLASGLPQSATGQTALFTGINPIPSVGRHITGMPTSSLKKILCRHSIFKQLETLGIPTLFANAYHACYFKRDQRFYSATTWAVFAQKEPHFLYIEDIRQEEAVFADITNDFLRREGFEVPVFTPEKAASILLKLSRTYPFVMYEIPFLDQLGHKQDQAALAQGILNLDRFLKHIETQLAADQTVILSSDHGNIEDLSCKTHTHNPVPLMVWNKTNSIIPAKIKRIEEIMPAIIRLLSPSVY